MMKSICFLIPLFCTALSYAGPNTKETDGIEVGNGGFVVQCPLKDSALSSLNVTEFFDYYEYKYSHPEWTISPSFLDADYYKSAIRIIDNYARIDGLSAESLRINAPMWYAIEKTQTVVLLLLKQNYEFKGAVPLVPAPKPFLASDLLKNCQTKQIISFVRNSDNSFNYSIDSENFALLNPINQAIALIHEIGYLEQIKAADTSPMYPNVIRQTQFIFSLPDLSQADAGTILDWQTENSLKRQAHRLEFSQYGKYKIRLRKPAKEMPAEIKSNQDYIHAYWSPLYMLNTAEHSQRILSAFLETITITDKNTDLKMIIGGRTDFHENGEIKQSPLKFPLFYNNNFCVSMVQFNNHGDVEFCE